MRDPEALFNSLTQLQADKKFPPVHLWNPEHVGRIDMRIDRVGDWYHEGSRIERQPLVDLFATILRKEDDEYFLVTPVEKMAIEVDDAPFIATDFEVVGELEATDLVFTTNVGDHVVADCDHALRMADGRPYLHVRDGLEALVHRNVYYRLVDVAIEQEGALYVYSRGARFSLGSVA